MRGHFSSRPPIGSLRPPSYDASLRSIRLPLRASAPPRFHPVFQIPKTMNPNLIIRVTELTEIQRTTLAEWQAELLKLATQRRASFRRHNRQLSTHLASAVRGAYSAIAEACAPAKSELVAAVLATVQPYFPCPGDARAAAVKFPALTVLAEFLRGPSTELALTGLTEAAEATAALIDKLLAGETVWRFRGTAP